MATINPIFQQLQSGAGHTALVTWANVTESDTCAPFEGSGYADRSVHAYGTFGGATLTMQVSNERAGISMYQSFQNGVQVASASGAPSHFVSAHTLQGTAWTLTADGVGELAEGSAWVQPSFASGSGQTVTVAMWIRRGF